MQFNQFKFPLFLLFLFLTPQTSLWSSENINSISLDDKELKKSFDFSTTETFPAFKTDSSSEINNHNFNSASCERPDNLAVSQITHNSVRVSWLPVGNETQWQVAYGPEGYDDPVNEAEIVMVNDNPTVVITGLDPDVTYDIYVRALCNGEDFVSGWEGPANFTTEAGPCEQPDNLAVSDITHNSVRVSWLPVSNETQWQVAYGPEGYDDPVNEAEIVMVNDNPTVVITGLDPDVTYDIYVRALCNGEDFVSGWEGPANFTTQTLGVSDHSFQNFIFYPNPTNDILILQSQNNIEKIVIYNVLGKKVLEKTPLKLETQINLSDISTGVYLMNVTLNGTQKIFRVIKD